MQSESDSYIDFEEIIRQCRRSQYHDVADVIEYFADHKENKEGREPIYNPCSAPHRDTVDSFRVLWAFRAGRAFETTKNMHDGGENE